MDEVAKSRKPRGKSKPAPLGRRGAKKGGHRKDAPARVGKTTPTPSATTAGLAVITESKPRKSPAMKPPAMKSVRVESPIKEGLVECFNELETQVNKGITQEQMQHLVIKLFNRNESGSKATTASTAKENTVPPSNSNTREAANDSSLRDQINGLDCHLMSPNASNTACSGQLFTPADSQSNKRKRSDVITPYTPNKLAFLTPKNKAASAIKTADRRVPAVTKCINAIGNEEQQVLVLMKALTDKSMLPMARKLGRRIR